MKSESIRIDHLNLDPANTRAHPPRNIEAIKASLARFGQQKPVVIDPDNVVIAATFPFHGVQVRQLAGLLVGDPPGGVPEPLVSQPSSRAASTAPLPVRIESSMEKRKPS